MIFFDRNARNRYDNGIKDGVNHVKKILALILCFAFLPGLSRGAASAGEEPEVFAFEEWQYILREDGTAEITRYSGTEAGVAVPEELDGKRITGIGDNAFSFCNTFTRVIIPDSVTDVGNNPFLLCQNLTEILVSPGHPTLEMAGGALISRPDQRLVCCLCASAAASCTIPEGVRTIGDYAFSGCRFLTSVVIPDGVAEIGKGAFLDCLSLADITIPDSVTSIGDDAFNGCQALTSITLSDRVTNLGDNPFGRCSAEIILSAGHPCLEMTDGALISRADRRLICYTGGSTEGTYRVPEGVQVIGNEAFISCGSLTGITIPDSVTSIGEYAFYDSRSLKNVEIPDTVSSIGEFAFFGCEALTVTVSRDSYAKKYCDTNRIRYRFP